MVGLGSGLAHGCHARCRPSLTGPAFTGPISAEENFDRPWRILFAGPLRMYHQMRMLSVSWPQQCESALFARPIENLKGIL